MTGRAGLVRSSLEMAVNLLKDSTDWNPPLKSASGTISNLISIITVSRGCLETVQKSLLIQLAASWR